MHHNDLSLSMEWFQEIMIMDVYISFIEDHALAGLVQLEELKIMACGLTSMPSVTDVKDTLLIFYLHYNHISYVPRGYFRGFKKLHYLSPEDNWLAQFPDVTDLSSTLISLEVQTNNITHFPNWTLNVSMEKLDDIVIFENRIREFPPIILQYQRKLRSISMYLNNLTRVSPYNGVARDLVTSVWIEGNPLHCDCSLSWVESDDVITDDDDVITGVIEYTGGRCQSPERLKGRYLAELGLHHNITMKWYSKLPAVRSVEGDFERDWT